MRADLHVHTLYSDGLLTCEQAVKTAAENGVKLLAITDHDCDLACESGVKLCEKYAISGVKGAEISSYFGEIKVHILVYNYDFDDKTVRNFFKELYENAFERTQDILKKLAAADVKLSMEEVERERFCDKSPLHSMHIARAAAGHGYAANPFDFYKNYLQRGKPAFSKIGRPVPERVVEIFTAAGGVCSLAHPGRVELDKAGLRSLLIRLKDAGLCGIEAVYSTHTKGQTTYFKELAKEFGLYLTGGSDTHCLSGNRKIGFPYFEPSDELLQKLLND